MQITQKMHSVLWTLLFFAATGTQVFMFQLWLNTPPSKVVELKFLLKEMNNYRAVHGDYPTVIENFSSLTNLMRNFSVYSGERATNDITWQPYAVSSHDFTVMVVPEGYEIFVPVGRMKMYSFSSFPVWRLDSNKRRWRKGRIHWFIGGSYWSKD